MNTLPYKILLIALICFAFIRCGLYLTYPEYFESSQLATALLHGTRFDLRLTAWTMLPMFILLSLPYIFHWQKYIARICKWLCFVILAVLVGIDIADIAYFGEVKRHMTNELSVIGNDLGFMLDISLGSRLKDTITIIIAVGILFFIWLKFLKINPNPSYSRISKTAILKSTLSIAIIILCSRGLMIKGKPISAIHAFNESSIQQANLTLNGTLVALDSSKLWCHTSHGSANCTKPYLDKLLCSWTT